MDRPLCIDCGKRLTNITWDKKHEKSYYRSRCPVCARLRNGKPKYNQAQMMGNQRSRKNKLDALKLGLDLRHCERCGWFGFCHVHHKHGINHNGDGDLEILCPNCHMEVHHGKPTFIFSLKKE